jgi:hypothetical protein
MSSADQPDSLPGTGGWRRFAAKNRYANSSKCAYFSKSSFNSSGVAASPADGNMVSVCRRHRSPRVLKRLCLRNWVAKSNSATQILRKLNGICGALCVRQMGPAGIDDNVEADSRNSRARKLHRQRQPKIAEAKQLLFSLFSINEMPGAACGASLSDDGY